MHYFDTIENENEEDARVREAVEAAATEDEPEDEPPAPELPPLLIRLKQPVCKLAADVIVEMPLHFALMFIRRRLAVPVGNAMAAPELVLSDQDEAEMEVQTDPVWLASQE